MPAHRLEEAHDAAADQRLAPGDAELLDAQPDEGGAEASSSSSVSSSALGRKVICSAMQ
jgi:hypothetical protein